MCLYELLHERRFLGNEGCHTALDILLYVHSTRPQAHLNAIQLEGSDDAGRAFAGAAAEIVEECWKQSWEERPSMQEVARRMAAAVSAPGPEES